MPPVVGPQPQALKGRKKNDGSVSIALLLAIFRTLWKLKSRTSAIWRVSWPIGTCRIVRGRPPVAPATWIAKVRLALREVSLHWVVSARRGTMSAPCGLTPRGAKLGGVFTLSHRAKESPRLFQNYTVRRTACVPFAITLRVGIHFNLFRVLIFCAVPPHNCSLWPNSARGQTRGSAHVVTPRDKNVQRLV